MLQRVIHNYFYQLKKFPKLTSLILVAIISVASLGLSNFRFDASSETLVLDSDSAFNAYEQVNERFGSSEFLVVAVSNKGKSFDINFLSDFQGFTNKLNGLESVESVVSILDAPLLEQPKVPLLKVGNNDKYLLKDQVDLDLALKEFNNSPIFNNLILNERGDIFAIQVNLFNDVDFSVAVQDIRQVLSAWDGEAYLAGPAMIVEDTIAFIKNDVLIFGSITFLLFSLLLLTLFKDIWSVTIIMANALLVMFFTVGFLGLFDWPISIVSSNFLALLLITSIAVSVHILVNLQNSADAKLSYEEALSEILIPCFYTAITTVAGFGALMFSGIKPVIDFGKMMMFGVTANFFISFIFIPLCINIRKINAKNVTNFGLLFANRSATARGFFERFSLPLILVAIPIFLYLSSGLKVENKFVDYFKKDTEIYKGMSLIDTELGGTTPIDITILMPEKPAETLDEFDFFYSEDSEVPDYWWQQDNMAILKSIQAKIEEVNGVGKVLSIANGISLAERLNNDLALGDLELIFIKNTLLQSETASDLIKDYISADDREVRVSLRTIDSQDNLNRQELITSLHNILNEELIDTNFSYEITGLGVLYNNLLQSLFTSQIKSLGFVFVSLFVMLLFLFRSIARSIYILVVPGLAVGSVLSLMALLEIPLDIMTITIASISVGMSVDYAIHFAWRYIKQSDIKSDHNDQSSLLMSAHEKATFQSAGHAILIVGITIVIGFLILIFSNFNPTILFGSLSALAILISMLLALLVLPRLLDSTLK
jgi:predicted RND superfamily exporter protein